jgi:hypothetical protein
MVPWRLTRGEGTCCIEKNVRPELLGVLREIWSILDYIKFNQIG